MRVLRNDLKSMIHSRKFRTQLNDAQDVFRCDYAVSRLLYIQYHDTLYKWHFFAKKHMLKSVLNIHSFLPNPFPCDIVKFPDNMPVI